MNLDHIGPTNAMKRCLEMQRAKEKPKASFPPPTVPAVVAPPLTLKTCQYVLPNLKATAKYNLIAGRIRKVQGRTGDKIDVKAIGVKPDGSSIVSLDEDEVEPCLPPPERAEWVIGLTTEFTGHEGKSVLIIKTGVVYRVTDVSADRKAYTIIAQHGKEERIVLMEVGKGIIEPCHPPNIENCAKVCCIDSGRDSGVLTVGKVYDVLDRQNHGLFINVMLDNGKDKPGYNKKFFEPYKG